MDKRTKLDSNEQEGEDTNSYCITRISQNHKLENEEKTNREPSMFLLRNAQPKTSGV